MKVKEIKIVIAGGLRTAFGHCSKSLAHIMPEQLMGSVIRELVKRTNLNAEKVSGVILGWVGQGAHAPNIARVATLKAGRLPETAHAVTIQANCLSGMEAICSAARHILVGEGDLYIAGGTESMSTFPFGIQGPRSSKALRSLETLKTEWGNMWDNPDVGITDYLEEGFIDPVKKLNMAASAEVCAQMFGITRENQDLYASESFRRCLNGQESGFYKTHVMPVIVDGNTVLEKDEYVYLRENLVSKPALFAKAPRLFDNGSFTIKNFYENYGEHIEGKTLTNDTEGTVTLFNACARSDGAAAVIVTTEEMAKELGLEILGEIKAWSFHGNNPAHMGIAPVEAVEMALGQAEIKFTDLNNIELHEAFAATCLSIFQVGKNKFGQDWEAYWKEEKLNPNGGSIPLGHPIAATGTRVLLNLLYSMKANPKARFGLAAGCAGGGLGGAMVVERAA